MFVKQIEHDKFKKKWGEQLVEPHAKADVIDLL